MPRMPSSRNAEPPISIRVSFMALYSLAACTPESDEKVHRDKSHLVQNMNIVNRSIEMKNPNTPVDRRISQRKKS